MKFYQTIIGIEVLSEEPLPENMALDDVLREINEGDYSGKELSRFTSEVDGQTMAKLLLGQGSDPEFFALTEIADGADICGGAKCTRSEGDD